MCSTGDRSPLSSPHPYVNLQKSRTGVNRLFHASLHSWAGLRTGWRERAFRQEVGLLIATIPLALWVGQTWVEVALLIGPVAILLIVELLNTAIEVTVDRVGMEWHPLSKAAKDLGSAAVLLACLACCAVWAAAVADKVWGH